MKHALSFFALLLILLPLSAQQHVYRSLSEPTTPGFRPFEQFLLHNSKGTYSQKLEYIVSDDGYERTTFSYNSQQQVVAIHQVIIGDIDVYDSIRYNSQGQMVRIDGYQLLNQAYQHVYYLEYTYNSQGLMATRTNYNNFSGTFQLGGVYTYTYNSDGQMVQAQLVMAGDSQPFQQVDYTYNNSLLSSELWSYNITGSWEPSEKLNYSYTNQQKVAYIYDSLWDGYSWSNGGYQAFTYDANGNCTRHSTYNTMQEVSRSEYEYNNYLLDETLMPWLPEQMRPANLGNTHAFDIEHWYQLDANQHFGFAWDYSYHYSDANSIESARGIDITVYPNPASSFVNIQGLDNIPVSIIDLSGRIVMKTHLLGGIIVLSSLPSGTYQILLPHIGSYPLVIQR